MSEASNNLTHNVMAKTTITASYDKKTGVTATDVES